MTRSAKRSSRISAWHAIAFAHLQDDRLILNYFERRIQRLVRCNALLAEITDKNNTELSINNKAPISRNGVHIPMNSMHVLII